MDMQVNKQGVYEVNGHTHFVPVKIIKMCPSGVDVTVADNLQSVRTLVNQVYSFPKTYETQQLVIPKLVADWFSKNPITYWWRKIAQWENDVPKEDRDVYNWYANYNETKFIQAWIAYPNIAIEQEPLYQVVISNTQNYKKQIQQLVNKGKNWFFCGNDINRFRYKFTKGQIEAAGFGWVFDCPGVEIKVEPAEE